MSQAPVPRVKVLIVDDVPTNVLLLERMLASSGIQTQSTSDPRRTVPMVIDFQPDLLLLDLHMPVMDGFQVLERLRSVVPPDDFLPVMVLTADISTPTRERALAAGADDFLSKPFDPTEVMLRVRNLLKTRARYDVLKKRTQTLEREVQRESSQRHQRIERSRHRASRVQAVLRGDGLSMHYQPIVSLQDGSLLGAEALARFSAKPVRSPHRWFTEAAEVGLGVELQVAAVEAAARGLELLPPSSYLAVNMAADAVSSPLARQTLERLPPQRTVVELTEHSRMRDYPAVAGPLADLRSAGVRVAVDEAGSGLSGLRHLGLLRPDIIKVARDLIRDVEADGAQRALISAMVGFGRELGASLVAEGVETEGEIAVLRGLGVDAAQGYLLGRPQPLPLTDRIWTLPSAAFPAGRARQEGLHSA